MQRVEIWPKMGRLLIVFVCGLLVLMASLWCAWTGWAELSSAVDTGQRAESFMLISFGVFGSIFFGICTLFTLFKILNPTPSLVLDDSGITDHSSVLNVGYIPWGEVQSVGTYHYNNQHFVGMNLRDGGAHIPGVSKRMIKLFKINQGLVGYQYSVPRMAIDRSVEALAELIKKQLQ